jgi:hypothetical protein
MVLPGPVMSVPLESPMTGLLESPMTGLLDLSALWLPVVGVLLPLPGPPLAGPLLMIPPFSLPALVWGWVG